MTESDLIVPAPGQTLPGSFSVRVRVRSEHTNDVLAVIEETVPPGALIPPHTHANDVWVKVEEGEIGVLVGEEIRTAVKATGHSSHVRSFTPCGIRPHDPLV
jgi:quercetin dioxygenase-like cupin family protein